MGKMSMCLCFPYYILAWYVCALLFVPEQSRAVSMPQDPSVQRDGVYPREGTGWSKNQLVDAVLTAQGKHRLSSARSDFLVVRIFVVTEELKKGLGRARGALGWFSRGSLQSARASMGGRSLAGGDL